MKSIARRFGRGRREDAPRVPALPNEMTETHVIFQREEVPAPLDSGVYVAAAPKKARDVEPAQGWVTLVVYGWENVQPGTLSWIFPSFTAAVSAVRALKNAVKWAILVGQRRAAPVDVEAERASGQVLLEAV